MLIKAGKSHLKTIESFCKNTTCGTRIICYAECYGFDRPFLEFYLCCEEETVKAVLMRFDDNLTVLTKANSFTDEMLFFIEMLKCNSIMCDNFFTSQGYAFIEQKTAYIYDGNEEGYFSFDVGEEKLKELYNLISKNIPHSFAETDEAYLSFLSDYTFRKLRSRSRAKGIFDDENSLVACSLTSAETHTLAIISGVACDLTKRNKGMGKSVVLSLTAELIKEGKKVLAIALNDSAKGFYEHIGFKKFENIYYFGRKN